VSVTPDEIIKRYEGWDPIIRRILEKNPNCSKWQLLELEKIPAWVSESGKVALMGDAAHAMLPFLAQASLMTEELLLVF
jgi:salicylate hydroxylase